MNEAQVHIFDTTDSSDDGEATDATDAELEGSKLAVFTTNGGKGRLSKELVQFFDGVIPGELRELPTESADYKYYVAPDPIDGKLRILKEHARAQTAHTGTFEEVVLLAYIGVRTNDPLVAVENRFYFNRLTGNFRAYIAHHDILQWQNITPDVLSTHPVEWLGYHTNDAQALHNIGTFDSANRYFYYNSTSRLVLQLTNSTYTEGSTVTYNHEWISVTEEVEQLIHALEEKTAKATDTEIEDGTETQTRGYAPDQLMKIVREKETYPWTHSISSEYNTTEGTSLTFRFTTTGGVTYLDFSTGIDGTVVEDWLKKWEKHDEFAIVDDTTKDEMLHAEVDGDYDETNFRIPIINMPDSHELIIGTDYLIECTRAAPDVGQELSRIREEVVEGIELFARRKVVSTAEGSEGEYVDAPILPIPLDQRYQNIPLPWKSEYLDARPFDPISDESGWTGEAFLHFYFHTVSGDNFLNVSDSVSSADVGNFSALRKGDLLGIFATEGTDDGNMIGFYRALADWDDSNGVELETIWEPTSGYGNYDDDEIPYDVRFTAFQILPEAESGAVGGSGNVMPIESLVLNESGDREWQDVLRDMQWEEIWKAGSNATDYTWRQTATAANISLQTGRRFSDYGEIGLWLDTNTEERLYFVSFPRDLWVAVSSDYGSSTDNDFRVEMYGYSSDYISLEAVSDLLFTIHGLSGCAIRAMYGKRS